MINLFKTLRDDSYEELSVQSNVGGDGVCSWCRRIYWTDWGVKAKIESAALDGTDRTVVINSSLVWPNGLAVDRLERRLYWADAELDRIEMAFVNGSDRRVLVCEDLPHVFGFALLGMHCFCFSCCGFVTVEQI